jgi:hypothetical protein
MNCTSACKLLKDCAWKLKRLKLALLKRLHPSSSKVSIASLYNTGMMLTDIQHAGNIMEAVVMQQQAEEYRKVGVERKNALNTLATTIAAAQKWTSTLKAAELGQQQRATKLSQMLTHAKEVAHSTDVLQLQDKKRLDLLQQRAQLQARCAAVQEEVTGFGSQVLPALPSTIQRQGTADLCPPG